MKDKKDKSKNEDNNRSIDPQIQEEVFAEEPNKASGETPESGGEAPVSEVSQEVLSLEAQLLEEKDKYLRLAAEYDNYRKRSNKEREAIFADVRVDTISRFLPVYDNLERAIEQETSDEAYKKGVEMTLAGLWEVMQKLGVTEIPALGEAFDPDVHNAIMHEEDPDRGEGEIVELFQKGFKLGDKVIRFALVKVAN